MSHKIEIFTAPGCSSCKQVKKIIKKVLDDLDEEQFDYQEVDITEDMERAQSLSIRSTPTIAIDDKVIFSGVPKEKDLISALTK